MKDERRMSLGATVRTLREARGLSRQDLASAAAISVEMLAKVEQGRKAPSAKTLASLASGLGIEAPDLAQRANAWQAFAAAGANGATLRAGTIAGTLGVNGSNVARALGLRAGAALTPGAALPVGLAVAAGAAGAAGASAVRREHRSRRVLEEILRSNLDMSDDELLGHIAARLASTPDGAALAVPGVAEKD